jgi:pimeloyl-ACP methyl ester carboxylesterase
VEGLIDFRVILVNHRGRGRSDRPTSVEAHKMDAYVSDILNLMDNLGLGSSAFWGVF